MAGTPESTREVLYAALDAWKSGRSFQEISAGTPPIQFVDDDLSGGTRLVDYKIEGEGKPRGTGYIYVVTLKLQEKNGGRTREKKVAYIAVSEPNRAVTREDRTP
jgi:hypothetical protein